MKKLSKYKVIWLIIGVGSLVWFLIRVIPKPSRASYPCQRAAFPLAASFVIWLSSLLVSLKLVIRARRLIRNNRLMAGVLLLLFTTATISFTLRGDRLKAEVINLTADPEPFVPVDGPNNPFGESYGLFPGRVVWFHNPEATSWDGETGNYWDEDNTSINEVNRMLSGSVDAITGATSNWDSWKMLFTDFNERKKDESRGYLPGEKIAIKLNMSNSNTHGNIFHNQSMSSPAVVLSLVRQLVHEAGVPDTCITIYDISQQIPAIIYNPVNEEFPGLRFVDGQGGQGRIKYTTDSTTRVMWSEELVLEDGGGHQTYLPVCVTEADYIINLALLKGHDMAGITLNAKNHVGTIISSNPDKPKLSSPRAAGIHPYATVHYFAYWDLEQRDMGTYNVLVDLMGHKDLGNKTLLFIVDGLYASKQQNGNGSTPNKWFMSPFHNDWTSSLFISQDNVAIESVCLDFLRSEPTMVNVYGNVDNYLHEAALANDPPSETFYSPDGTPNRLASLGIHEHWNNAEEKLYNGNLNPGRGIELIKLNAYKVEDLFFNLTPGEYEGSISLEIHSPTDDVQIYYTLDGGYPDESSLLYEEPIEITSSLRVNARGFKEGYESSELISGEYVIAYPTGLPSFTTVKPEIWPTVFENELNIRFADEYPHDVDISLYSLDGRLVQALHRPGVRKGELVRLSVQNMESGACLISIRMNNQRIVSRVFRK